MLTIIAAMLAVAPATASVIDPKVPIRQGKIRCGWPDAAHKTCRSLARHTRMPGDGFEVSVEGLPGEDGLVLRYKSRGRIEHNQLCITITNDDVMRATFTKSGVTLIGAALTKARDWMRDAYAPLLGREICDRDDAPGADGISDSVSFVDGVLSPNLDRTVKWVGSKDGYVLGPLPNDMA